MFSEVLDLVLGLMIVVCGWFNSVWSWFMWTGLWDLRGVWILGLGFWTFVLGCCYGLVAGVLFVLLMLVACGCFAGVCDRLVGCVL